LSCTFGLFEITLAKIIAHEKIVAPNKLPKGIRAVYSDVLFPAIIAVSTSGAPFAKAKKVTPANV
jgi:hypothetical protein